MAKQNRKQQIVAAFISLVAGGGYQGTTMADVGSVVGFRASANYKHFRNKAAIHKAACAYVNGTKKYFTHKPELSRFVAQSYMAGGQAKENIYLTFDDPKVAIQKSLQHIAKTV